MAEVRLRRRILGGMLRRKANRIRGVSGSLDGATVLVADAAVRAGPGIVRVLAEAGATVFAHSANAAELDVQLAQISVTPEPIMAMPPSDLARLVQLLPQPLDALVLNPPPAATHSELDTWLDFTREIAATMRDRGHAGAIAIVTGLRRSPEEGPTAARLRAETEELAIALAPDGIRVNGVAIGTTGASRKGRALSSRTTPLGHVTVHPVEVGKAVWFLLNDALSSAITGAWVTVDRGASLRRPEH